LRHRLSSCLGTFRQKGAKCRPLFQEIKAASPLDLSADNYETMTMKVEGRDVTFRAYTDLL